MNVRYKNVLLIHKKFIVCVHDIIQKFLKEDQELALKFNSFVQIIEVSNLIKCF